MNNLQVDVQGFDELVRKIKILANDKDKRREILMILKQISKPTLSAAKQNVKDSEKPHLISGKRTRKIIQPGNLKKSLNHITGRKGSSKDNPTIYVGARVKGAQDGFYAHWVHEGHNIYAKGFKRKRTKGANMGAAKKRTKANPFLRNAYNQTGGRVTSEAEAQFSKFLQRRIDKLSSNV
jgi:hypothetical protein